MRNGFFLLLAAVGVVWNVAEPLPREFLLRSLAQQRDHVLGRVHGGESGGAVTESVLQRRDELRSTILDPDRDPTVRLGAAELYWLTTEFFEEGPAEPGEGPPPAASTLLTIALELPEEPGFLALALDALRLRQFYLGREAVQEREPRQEAQELIHYGLRNDPDNGLYSLFAAEVALSEDRVEEARDLLLIAARAPGVDAYRRRRFEAAEDFLTERGFSQLASREYLLLERVGGDGGEFGIGPMLERIADDAGRRLGPVEDSERLRAWVALARLGSLCARSAMLVQDAREALTAEETFVKRGRIHAFGDLVHGRSYAELTERFAAAGMAGAWPDIEAERSFKRQFLDMVARPEREAEAARRSTEDFAVVREAHGMLVLWAMVGLATALVLGAIARFFAEPKRHDGAPTGLFIAATAAPGLLLLYLAARRFGPFASTAAFEAAVRSPGPWISLVPFVSLLVFVPPCLGDKRLRNPGILLRELARLCLLIVSAALLLFALNAGDVGQRRDHRLRALAGMCVDASLAEEAARG